MSLDQFGVDPGVDPTQTPGRQPPSLPPPQADMAKPSRMIAQTPSVAGALVMIFASPLMRQFAPS